METGLDDDQVVPTNRVDESVLVGDSARPVAGEVLRQSLRLAGADTRIAQGLSDQSIDAFEYLRFICPGQVVVPAVLVEDQPNALRTSDSWSASSSAGISSVCSSYSPRSIRAMLSSRRRALAGLRRRCAVSSNERHCASGTRNAVPLFDRISTGS